MTRVVPAQTATARAVVAQIGARMHYAVPAIFQRAGILERFYTDLCAELGWVRAARMVLPVRLLPSSARRLFARRVPEVPRHKISCFSAYGLRRIYHRSKVTSPVEMFRHLVEENQKFASLVAARGLGAANIVYAFNGAALEILEHAKAHSVHTVLEQISPPVGFDEKLLADERIRWRGWEFEGAAEQDWRPMADRERREWELADVIVCGSQYVVEAMRAERAPIHKCVIVPYAAESDQFRPQLRRKRQESLQVLCVATLQLRKGVQYLIETASLLKGQLIDIRLVGPCQVSTEAMRQLQHSVTVVGSVPRAQMAAEFTRADVFVLPTISEGSAIVCYEALAAGLPVITTPNAGSVIRDGVDGYIVPIRDPKRLAEQIMILHRDRDLLERLSLEASRTAEQYTWDRYGERLLKAVVDTR